MKQKLLYSIRLRIALLVALLCSLGTGSVWADDPVVLYSETFGSTTSNTAFSSYTGYSATTDMFSTSGTVQSHYSGSGKVGRSDISASNLSSGYTGASGLSGCYHAGTANTEATIVQISNINIEGYTDLSLSFGALGGSSSHKVNVSYKIDDGAVTSLISNGAITNASWTLLSEDISGTGSSLTLYIKHKPTNAWTIRLDDIKVTGVEATPAYTITAVSNNDSWGTVSGTSTITATPATGYRVMSGTDGYTVTDGEATVTNNGDNTFSVSASADCTVRINFEAIPTHTLSSAVSPVGAGTVTLDATSIMEGSTTTATAAANSGYKFKNWSITGTGASLSSTSTNPTTVTMGTTNATVTATFEAVTTYEINWSVNGTIVKTENVEEDAALVFSAPASGVPSGYTFKGWVVAANKIDVPTNTNPSANYVTSGTSTENITYYAVMAKVISTTPGSWSETSLSDLTSSDVFVITDGTYAINNDNGTDGPPTPQTITISDSKITSEVADKLKWNLSGNSTDGYTFYPNGTTESWLYCSTTAKSGSNNNIKVGTGDRKVWEEDEDGYLMTKDTYVTRYLSRYDESGTPKDYRGYTSTGSAIEPLFYKYIAPVSTYGGYCTTATVSVTVTDADFATFASPFNLDFTGKSIKAYIAEANGKTGVTFTQVEMVPANTGILLYKDGGTTEDIPVFNGTGAADVSENVFKVGTGAELPSVDGTLHNYILNNHSIYGLGFFKAAGKKVATNRAYIQIDESVGVKEFIALPNFGDETGVESIEHSPLTIDHEAGAVFDLSGRRVSKAQKGLYIVNGKKVLVK